jgi:hypothetical protein
VVECAVLAPSVSVFSAFGNSFELQALSSLHTETVLNDLLTDKDGVDDFLKSLDIPAQETCNNGTRFTCYWKLELK